MMRFTEYFLEDNAFEFIGPIREGDRPWSAVSSIRALIEDFIAARDETDLEALEESARVEGSEDAGFSIVVDRPIVLPRQIVSRAHGFCVGGGTLLEPGAIIKAPCVIGSGCEIRQGAYMRGDVIVGDRCVIGHVTEVKNSIFMDNSNAGHFSYVGDSIIGSCVNLGAGTILANLQFRTRGEIDGGRINEIVIRSRGEEIATGMGKLGAVIGDYTEIGCNTVTAPGTMIGNGSWIYPTTAVPKGFYDPGSVIKNPGGASVEISRKPPG